MTRDIARLLTLGLIGLMPLSCAKQKPPAVKAGDLDVQIAIEPDPPSTGENRLRISIRDASGKPVDGGQLTFEYAMPAMGAMPEMKGGGEVKAEGAGRYIVTYPLSMQGDWYLTLGIDAPGHPHASLKLKVSPPRKGFAVGGKGAATETGPKVIEVSPERQQLIGLTFDTVEERPLAITVPPAGPVPVPHP